MTSLKQDGVAWLTLFASTGTLEYQVDAQFSYQARNEVIDFEAGDVARFDTSLQYRLLRRELSSGLPEFLYGVIEANLIHQQKNKLNGAALENDYIGRLSVRFNF